MSNGEKAGEVFIGMPCDGYIPIDVLPAYMDLKKPKHYFRTNNIVPLDAARNQMVKEFLVKSPSATHMLLWDSDVKPEAEHLMMLWEHDEPIVSGLLFKKLPPFEPLMSLITMDQYGNRGYVPLKMWEDGKPYYVDAVGLGFILIRKDVFQNIPYPWFKFTDLSEDYYFCQKARDAGYKIKVDTRVIPDHISDRLPITKDIFARYQQDLIAKQVMYRIGKETDRS